MQKIKLFCTKHKKLVVILSILMVILLGVSIYGYIGVRRVLVQVSVLKADANKLKQDQSAKSYTALIADIQKFGPDIDNVKKSITYFGIVRYLPIVNGYYGNTMHMLTAARDIDDGAVIIVQSAGPIADSLGYGAHPVNGSAKIAAFVDAIPTLAPAIDTATPDFDAARNELQQINPAYIPPISINGQNLKTLYTTYVGDFENVVSFLPKVKSLAPVVQHALGDPVKQNYLLLFQNDKELRPGGGFISVYAFVGLNKGSLDPITTDDIYNLDRLEQQHVQAPIQLQEYNSNTLWYLRDANLSPDIPTDAKQIETFYNTIPGRKPIDGVIFIDTQFVSSLLDAVGPIYLPGYKLNITSANAAYWMEYYSEKADVLATDRKQFIGVLMKAIRERIFAAQKDQLVKLLSITVTDFQQKHLAMYANDPMLESTLATYAMAGVFPQNVSGDFFAMVEANLGGAKADFYIKRNITQTLAKQGNRYVKTVSITFSNNQVYDDWLNGPYKAWVRFYVPKGSSLISLTNVDGTLREYNELGYFVVDDHIRVPVKYQTSDPAATLILVLKYYLPDNFSIHDTYDTYMYKQSGVSDINVTINYQGKKQQEDILTDQSFIL